MTRLRHCAVRKGRVASLMPESYPVARLGPRGVSVPYHIQLRLLLRPLLTTLLHATHEVLAPLVERGRELVAVTVHRPRRALLHEREELVHFLFFARNCGRAAIARHDRFIGLAGGDEVDAVLGDFLVAPPH